MKKKLIRMLALVLCFCALLSFAACGEDAPAKDDDIKPPANDTPTADEPEEPSADEPTKPDVPVEPSEPTEPDAPVEPTQPTEPDVPNGAADKYPNWNPEDYENILSFTNCNSSFLVAKNDGKVYHCFEGIRGFTTQPSFSVDILDMSDDFKGDLYYIDKSNTLYRNNEPFLESIKSIDAYTTRVASLTQTGELWYWYIIENHYEWIDGKTVLSPLPTEPKLIFENAESYLFSDYGLYILSDSEKMYQIKNGATRLIAEGIKEMISPDFAINTRDELISLNGNFSLLDICQAAYSEYSGAHTAKDKDGKLWLFYSQHDNSTPIAPAKVGDNCKYIFGVSSTAVYYIDGNHTLWRYFYNAEDSSKIGTTEKVADDVLYMDMAYSTAVYIKADGTLWRLHDTYFEIGVPTLLLDGVRLP